MSQKLFEETQSLLLKGDVDGAIRGFSEFLNGDFFNDEALFMLGGCFMSAGMNGLGAVLTSVAIEVRSAKGRKFPEAMTNLGAAYKAEHDDNYAEKIWFDALNQEIDPVDRAKIMCNIGGLYLYGRDPELAIEWCDKALAEDPKLHGASVNRGLACLELGRWREGWVGWQHTYAAGDRNKRHYGEIPEWDGSPGQTVIVWGDQGVGDEIYYASCLPDMIKHSKRIILDCHPRLIKLFERSFPGVEIHGTRKNLTELPWLRNCDAEASVCIADLPGHFRNNGEWDGDPYLKTDGELRRMTRRNGNPLQFNRIGLSWHGGTKKTRSDLRSMSISELAPIIRSAPNAEWFSLQYTPDAAREVCEFEETTGIRVAHYPGKVECFDYDQTASFVASLDLVISVCTTVHHLAGSLGIPVWTLVPSRPNWKYGGKSEKSPWYGSARLFRQTEDGDWSRPVGRIARELADQRRLSAA